MKLNRRKILLLVFFAWIAIWINFFIRDLTKAGYLRDYKALLSRDREGKAAYTYGPRLYEFLKFCDRSMPAGAGYDLAGITDLDFRRSVYYLYPRFKGSGEPYILVFDKPGYAQDGYAPFKELDPSRFILKRR